MQRPAFLSSQLKTSPLLARAQIADPLAPWRLKKAAPHPAPLALLRRTGLPLARAQPQAIWAARPPLGAAPPSPQESHLQRLLPQVPSLLPHPLEPHYHQPRVAQVPSVY